MAPGTVTRESHLGNWQSVQRLAARAHGGQHEAARQEVQAPAAPLQSQPVFARYLAHREAVVEEGRLLYPECPVPPEALVMVSKRAHGLRPCSDTALDAAVHAIEVRVAARGRPLHLSSHMLRRSGATMLEESLLESPSASRDGVYRTVQEFLRHENLATTMRYLESNPQRQRKALDLYGEALPWAEPRT